MTASPRNRTCTAPGSPGNKIERMVVDGIITDAQTIAAWTLLRLSQPG